MPPLSPACSSWSRRRLCARAAGGLPLWALAGCHLATQGTGDWTDDDGPTYADAGLATHDADDAELGSDADAPASSNTPGGPDQPGDRAPEVDASRADGGTGAQACALAGSYALYAEIDISWDGWVLAGIVPVLSPGSGTMTLSALSVLDDATSEVTVQPCGVTIPDFETDRAFTTEYYGAYFPDKIWELSTIPTWRAQWRATCDAPDCTFLSGALEAVLGARVTSMPFSWPDPSMATPTGFAIVDDDADGNPGVTMSARGPGEFDAQGREYSYPPVVPSFARARRIMLALGLRAQLEGKLDSCDAISGSLTPDGVYTRALGCDGRYDDDTPFTCDDVHVSFLDQSMPKWITHGARFRAVRISDTSCKAVRAAAAKSKARLGADAGAP